MGRSIFERIQARIELFRLEQRYTRSRHRRSTFQSNAIYVDGEYIYQTPNSTGSSSESYSTNVPRINALHEEPPVPEPVPSPAEAAEERRRKKLNRFSSMPGFGSEGHKPTPVENWRPRRASIQEESTR